MSADIPTQELDKLRQSVRRWKTLALTLLVGMGLVIVLGTGAAAVRVDRARQAEQAAREAEMQARQQADEARDQALQALDKLHAFLTDDLLKK